MPVYGHESQYEVSNRARVRKGARILKQSIASNGYYRASIAGKNVSVHRLVAFAFHGPSELPLVRHLNGDCLDNRPENLRHGTWSENSADRIAHGNCAEANKTHCKNGHEFSAENTRIRKGVRNCRMCSAAASRRYQARKSASDE